MKACLAPLAVSVLAVSGLLVSGPLVGGPLFAGDDAAALIRKERDRLQGAWKVIDAYSKGERVPPEEVEELFLVFRDELIQVREGEKINDKFTYKLDPSKKPKEIDFTFTEGPKKGRTDKAIYLLDGDDLKFCIQEAKDSARPTEFESKPGTMVSMVILKRAKN